MESDKKKSQEISPKNTYLEAFFSDDNFFYFLVKKTEKLVAAVYLVTNLFPENDSLKNRLRDKSSDFLYSVIEYKRTPNSLFPSFSNEVSFKVFSIVSLLETSTNGGLLSYMNFSILKEEFDNFLGALNNKNDERKEVGGDLVSKTFFEIEQKQFPTASKMESRESRGSLVPSVLYQDSKDYTMPDKIALEKRSSRQTTILNLIKKKKEVTIKDISEVIKNCSEKTIQRELISFIKSGIVRRVGERRWSKYSLV